MPFLVPFIPQIVGAVASVGAGAIATGAANKASKNAVAAQQAATDKSLAAQQAALDRITSLNQPFINAGSSVLPNLQSRVNQGAPNFSAPSYARPQGYHAPAAAPGAPPAGNPAPVGEMTAGTGNVGYTPLPGPSTAKATGVAVDPASAGPQTPQASGPDWDAYIQQHPDVAQWIQQGHGDPSLGPDQTPEQAAQYQYENSIRLGTPFPAPPMKATPQQAQDPNAQPQGPLDLGTASPVVADYTRPDQGSAPNAADFLDPSKFTTSPGYQFRMDEALRNTNAKFGARGLLQSGAALKGFNDQIQNTASAEYNNWFNQQNTLYNDTANQFNINRNNTNNNFAEDRSYGTNLALNNRDFANNQYNTGTQNLFQLAGVGANAAAAVGGANNNYANNASNLYTNQGNNAAQNAYNIGNNNAQLAGTIGATAQNLFSAPSRYTGGTALPVQSYTNPVAVSPAYTAATSGPITYQQPITY